MHDGFANANLLKAFLDFLLQASLKVELVDAVEWHDGMQQVIGVEALCADLLLTLEAEQDKLFFGVHMAMSV